MGSVIEESLQMQTTEELTVSAIEAMYSQDAAFRLVVSECVEMSLNIEEMA